MPTQKRKIKDYRPFRIRPSKNGQFHVSLVAKNGNNMMKETYERKAGTVTAINSVVKSIIELMEAGKPVYQDETIPQEIFEVKKKLK